jgi:hypothetical protein
MKKILSIYRNESGGGSIYIPSKYFSIHENNQPPIDDFVMEDGVGGTITLVPRRAYQVKEQE